MKRPIWTGNILVKTFFTYLVTLMLPFFAIFPSYTHIESTLYSAYLQQAETALEQTTRAIDSKLKELELITYSIVTNPYIVPLQENRTINSSSPDVYMIYEACKKLPDYSVINPSIKSYCVFFRNNPYVISSDNAYIYSPNTDNLLYEVSGMRYDRFNELIWDQYYINDFVYLNDSSLHDASHIGLLYSYDRSHIMRAQCVVLIRLKDSMFINMLSGINNARFSIYDADGMQLFSNELYIQPDTPLLTSSIVSDYTGWEYRWELPEYAITNNIVMIKYLFVTILSLTVIIGIMLAYWISRNRIKLLVDIVNFTTPATIYSPTIKNSPRNEDTVRQAVRQIVQDKQHMQNLIEHQKFLADTAVLFRLVQGAFDSQAEIDKYLEGSSFAQRRNCRYITAIIHIIPTDMTQLPMVSTAANQYILLNDMVAGETAPTISIVPIKSDEQFIVCFARKNEDDEQLDKRFVRLLENLHDYVDHQLDASATIAVANMRASIYDMRESYQEAFGVLQRSTDGSGQFLFRFTDNNSAGDTYYYPIDKEIQIIHMIQHGDEGELVSLMQDIVDENFSKRELSFSMKQQLVFCFRATALRALKGETIIDDRGDMFGQLDSFSTLDQMLGYIIKINKALCKRNREQRAAQEATMRSRLKQYIDMNYTDPDLTIYHVCHEFNINEQQAYRLFRDCLGATFAETIEKLRIRRACELLLESGSAVKDIAGLVGYANDNSFRRAFKRVLGVSPSEYMRSKQ